MRVQDGEPVFSLTLTGTGQKRSDTELVPLLFIANTAGVIFRSPSPRLQSRQSAEHKPYATAS